jgi:hypothetical protein
LCALALTLLVIQAHGLCCCSWLVQGPISLPLQPRPDHSGCIPVARGASGMFLLPCSWLCSRLLWQLRWHSTMAWRTRRGENQQATGRGHLVQCTSRRRQRVVCIGIPTWLSSVCMRVLQYRSPPRGEMGGCWKGVGVGGMWRHMGQVFLRWPGSVALPCRAGVCVLGLR